MNSKATIIAVLAVIIIVGGGIIAYKAGNNGSVPASNSGTSAPLESTNPNAGGSTADNVSSGSTNLGATYTLADVAKHADASSCWTAVDGNVYDVTAWINEHPGGPEAILSTCGVDASAAFNDQHGGQRRPATELSRFRIGTLATR